MSVMEILSFLELLLNQRKRNNQKFNTDKFWIPQNNVEDIDTSGNPSKFFSAALAVKSDGSILCPQVMIDMAKESINQIFLIFQMLLNLFHQNMTLENGEINFVCKFIKG